MIKISFGAFVALKKKSVTTSTDAWQITGPHVLLWWESPWHRMDVVRGFHTQGYNTSSSSFFSQVGLLFRITLLLLSYLLSLCLWCLHGDFLILCRVEEKQSVVQKMKSIATECDDFATRSWKTTSLCKTFYPCTIWWCLKELLVTESLAFFSVFESTHTCWLCLRSGGCGYTYMTGSLIFFSFKLFHAKLWSSFHYPATLWIFLHKSCEPEGATCLGRMEW